jgi:hypothetical protein
MTFAGVSDISNIVGAFDAMKWCCWLETFAYANVGDNNRPTLKRLCGEFHTKLPHRFGLLRDLFLEIERPSRNLGWAILCSYSLEHYEPGNGGQSVVGKLM